MIGKLSQVGVERVVGTILGGVSGYGVYELGKQFWDRRCAVASDVVLNAASRGPNIELLFEVGDVSKKGAAMLMSSKCCLTLRSEWRRDDEVALSLAAGAVAFLGNWGGSKLKLDYSGEDDGSVACQAGCLHTATCACFHVDTICTMI